MAQPATRRLQEPRPLVPVICCRERYAVIYADRWVPSYSTFDDFANLHSNLSKTYTDKNDGKLTIVPLGKWWLGNKNRRQYNDGLRYMPHHDADVVGEALNLWRGFIVPPRKGDCSLYLAHMKDNICSGNEANYQYLLRLMADAVQNRGRPSGVATCLRGGKGTGKGFFIRTFGRLFGQHFLAVTNAEHLTGKFNQHLETVSILFADECFFAGDRKHEQILKVLVTEPTIIVEPKGINAYEAPNYLHIFMASNSDWIVPASGDERRYFVLDVGTGSQQAGAYFAAIADQMKAGGYEALLDLLLGLDLSGFDVRKVPKTDALRKQQALTRRGVEGLVEEALSTGIVPCPHPTWPGYTVTSDEQFAKFIHDYGDSDLKRCGVHKVTLELASKYKCRSGATTRRRDGKSGFKSGIQWPPLPEMRAAFGSMELLNPDITEWQMPGEVSGVAGSAVKSQEGTDAIPF